MVALNFAGQSRSFNLCELQAQSAFLRISTYLDREHERVENELFLRADEGVIVELIRTDLRTMPGLPSCLAVSGAGGHSDLPESPSKKLSRTVTLPL